MKTLLTWCPRFLLTALTLTAALVLPAGPASSHRHHDHGHKNNHDHQEHGAHVHGLAELNLVLEGPDLEIEMISPAMNKVGFEHPPSNREQREAVATALATLRDGSAIFGLPTAANCRQLKAEVGTNLEGPAAAGDHSHGHGHDKHQHDDDRHHDHAHANDHADFTAHWHFRCEQPQHLNRIEVLLFQAFPATHRIRVQAITPKGQLGVELTPASRHLDLQ